MSALKQTAHFIVFVKTNEGNNCCCFCESRRKVQLCKLIKKNVLLLLWQSPFWNCFSLGCPDSSSSLLTFTFYRSRSQTDRKRSQITRKCSQITRKRSYSVRKRSQNTSSTCRKRGVGFSVHS